MKFRMQDISEDLSLSIRYIIWILVVKLSVDKSWRLFS